MSERIDEIVEQLKTAVWEKYKEANAKYRTRNQTNNNLDVDDFIADQDFYYRWDANASKKGPSTMDIINLHARSKEK